MQVKLIKNRLKNNLNKLTSEITLKNIGINLCLLFTFLIAGSSFAKWVEIGRNDQVGMTVSYENESIAKTGELSQMKVLYNFSSPNADYKILHSSEVEVVTFDCKRRKLRLDDVRWYRDRFARGAQVWQTKNLEWQSLERGSSYESLFAYSACRK
jgi:hypothetical protein